MGRPVPQVIYCTWEEFFKVVSHLPKLLSWKLSDQTDMLALEQNICDALFSPSAFL